jgi:hypothetical protein
MLRLTLEPKSSSAQSIAPGIVAAGEGEDHWRREGAGALKENGHTGCSQVLGLLRMFRWGIIATVSTERSSPDTAAPERETRDREGRIRPLNAHGRCGQGVGMTLEHSMNIQAAS